MDEKRKKLLCDILAEADKMRIEKTWPVSEDELEEHSGIRDSYEFGFLCGYLLCKEQMMKHAVDGEVGECYPTTIHLDKDISELKHFDKVKLIIIME